MVAVQVPLVARACQAEWARVERLHATCPWQPLVEFPALQSRTGALAASPQLSLLETDRDPGHLQRG